MAKKPDDNLCLKCTALCCKYITVEVDIPSSKRERDDIRWYLMHEGISLLIEEERWLLQCTAHCRYLLKDNRCGIYDTRPNTCREYSTENCDYHSVYGDWETEYREIKDDVEFEEYIKEQKAAKKRKKTQKKKKAKKD